MLKRWVETKEYQLKDGRWVPKAQVCIEVPGGVDVSDIVAPTDVTFSTREDARGWSRALGEKWLAENG